MIFCPKTCFSLDLLMWGLILESILGPAGHPPAHLESAGIFLVPVWDPRVVVCCWLDYFPPRPEHHARSKPNSHELDLTILKMNFDNNTCINIWSIFFERHAGKNNCLHQSCGNHVSIFWKCLENSVSIAAGKNINE